MGAEAEPENEKPGATSDNTSLLSLLSSAEGEGEGQGKGDDKELKARDKDKDTEIDEALKTTAPDDKSNFSKSNDVMGTLGSDGNRLFGKTRGCKKRERVCPVWAAESHAKNAQLAYLIDDSDDGSDSVLIEWASTWQLVWLPYSQITSKTSWKVNFSRDYCSSQTIPCPNFGAARTTLKCGCSRA